MYTAVKQTETWKKIRVIRRNVCPGIKCGISSQFGGSAFAEIRDGGLQKIVDVLVSTGLLLQPKSHKNQKIVAIDVGSGLGKFLFFLASTCLELKLKTRLELRGIEINASSFQQAVATSEAVKTLFPNNYIFQFSNGDAQQMENSFLDDVHIMYAFNRAVPREVFRHVCAVCNASSCLKIIFSSLDLHQLGLNAQKFQMAGEKIKVVAEGGNTSSVIRVYFRYSEVP